MPDPVDVAVVGAGPAGLTTALRLARTGRSVRVFERSGGVGGRTRSATVAGERVNTGAMFVYVGTESSALCRELGAATVPVTPGSIGVARAGRTVLARDDGDLVDALDLPTGAARQLGAVLRRARDDYEAYTGPDGLGVQSTDLAHVSFAEHLGQLHPAVDGILRNLVQGGSTAPPEALSAQYALRYVSSYLLRAAGHREYLPRGMQEISEQLAARLRSDVVDLNATVTSVTPGHGGYVLAVDGPDGARTITAAHVVFAVPGPIVAELAPWLPAWKTTAIARVHPNPTVTLAIVLDSSDRPNWDDIFVIATVDAAFNMVLQPRAGADRVPSRHGRTTMMCYLSSDDAVARPGDDAATTAAWLEDFYEVLPDARGRVLGTLLTRWPHCFSHVAPDRGEVLPEVRRRVGDAHFAGDYTSATAGVHGAVAEGARVAAEIAEQP